MSRAEIVTGFRDVARAWESAGRPDVARLMRKHAADVWILDDPDLEQQLSIETDTLWRCLREIPARGAA